MGIGVMVEYHQDGSLWCRRYGAYLGDGTNNQAELWAIARGIILAKSLCPGQDIHVYTDSKYAIGSITSSWSASKNLDIIDVVKDLASSATVHFHHVKGHAGDYGNEMVDKIAKHCTKHRLLLEDTYLKSELPAPPR